MGIDLDPLDDIFTEEGVKTARPAGKFQPKAKAKFRPTKKDSAAPSVSSSHPPQTIDAAPADLRHPVETAKPMENYVVLNDNESGCASVQKAVAENVDIFIGLEALGDILPNNTTDMITLNNVKESTAPPSEVPSPENTEVHVLPVPASADDATHTFKGDDVPTCPVLLAGLDPLTAGETIVSSGDECDQIHDGELNRVEVDIMDSISVSELTTTSEQRRGKFQPKPKIQAQKGEYEPNESVSCSLDSQSLHPESSYTEKDSVPTFQQDDMLDLSDLGFTHSLPTEVTPEIPLTEQSVNHTQMTPMDSGIHVDVVAEIPVKLTSRRANSGRSKTQTTSAPTQQQQASTSSEGNEMRRSSRPRKSKTNLHELVDEANEEMVSGEENSDEIPINSAVEEENVLNGESQLQNESQKKKNKRKPKKPDDGKEKSARKRKKAEGAPDKGADTKPKKFSHSTRRRRVDKSLLETPEDEIDYQKVPLRDLILLAEHKERQLKKDEAATGATATKQSNGNSSSHEAFNTRQDGEHNDGQGSPGMEDTTVYFNYQTHMDKTPATRWSKQETELFYEAVRQFGTDRSMIQQLFPDRTRRQVKLKYKKEERQHPLRLREALTNRSKDHSHFNKVIEQLKKIAAEEKQNTDKDDPVDLTGIEGDEGTSNVDKEETKDEQIEEEENGDVAVNEFEAQSPSNFDDNDEDDLFIWSQYKSDT